MVTGLGFQSSGDAARWNTLALVRTDRAGNAAVAVRPSRTTYYRTAVGRTATTNAASSRVLRLTVYPALAPYRNCDGLNSHYPHGVGTPGAKDRTSGTPVTTYLPSAAAYALNDGGVGQRDLDRDDDGIACEKR
ncbi:hypothetical protein D5H78_13135 [Vallicoccus soli]|uniref:Uncharacterized protein n=2 Tax=Vallicoccus soli TaxID=2339232 RepID=A0A3A3YTZ8_9ACTN|nr:hypothetical protein D5H78_13135 [Vallicoccus soli]